MPTQEFVLTGWLAAMLLVLGLFLVLLKKLDESLANLAEIIPPMTLPALIGVQGVENIWTLEFEVEDLEGAYKMFRLFEAESENTARDEGREMSFNLGSDDAAFSLSRILDASGNPVWIKQ